jgi:Protein of unknown function (DUF2846)
MFLACLAVALLVTGCMSEGPKYSEIGKSLPVSPEQARIIIYRPAKFVFFSVIPQMELNGQIIGDSWFGGFYYVDVSPGQYEIKIHDYKNQPFLSLLLEKGQSYFVRLAVSKTSGIGGLPYPELVTPIIGEKEIQDCFYIYPSPPEP